MKLVVDTHTHTISSGHAYSTIQENAIEAGNKGIEAIAMTDHAPSMIGAPTYVHFWNMDIIPDYIRGVRIIKGAEANIIDYCGKLDVPDEILRRMEFVNASFHDITIKPATVEEHTSAMINAIKNPMVDAIAHPGNPVFQVDIDAVVRAAAEYGKLIEINNNSFNIRKGCSDNCLEFVKKCKKYGVRVTCGSDAHICYDIGSFGHIMKLLDEADMPEELVICTAIEKIEEFIEYRKAFKKALHKKSNQV